MRITVGDRAIGRLGEAWRTCVGTGRFALALRRDYQDSLAMVQADIGFRLIRGHGLLSDDVGIHRPYEHDGRRQVRHAFTYLDQVVDAYLALGIKPFLELGFMPSGLASGEATVFWWRGNITPPADHAEWARLIQATLRHLIDRYGREEVLGWPIEVWNEPNLEQFWLNADQQAYHELYAVTAQAVKDVDPSLQVGGPAISPGNDEFLDRFVDFVVAKDVPIDFVSRHAYTSGPSQHVPFGTHQTMMPAARLLEQFGRPRQQLAGTPLANLPVHITEFNSSYRPDNPIHDTAWHAAYLAPVLTSGGELVDSFSYWTFSDMFEEVGIPTALFHGGFGLLTHRQIRKPTYHLYAFMARLGDEVLARGDDHLVTRFSDGRLAVLAWAPVEVDTLESVDGHRIVLDLPMGTEGPAFLARSRVHDEVGNAYSAWDAMGRPASPAARELAALREASEPGREHRRVNVRDGRLELDLTLTRNEVTLVELRAVADETPPWWDERRMLGAAVDG
jgi:xylan 1,4-beta-xylosidase